MTTPIARDAMPITATPVRWFDHAGVAPLPARTSDAIAAWGAAQSRHGRPGIDANDDVRALTAQLLGVDAADVAITRNTTDGIGLVAAGVRWRAGDRVVVPACEFPSNLFPWLQLRDRDVTVDVVPLAELREAIDAGAPPKVVAVSWVQYARGERVDLAELAAATHRRGGLLVADVIQGAGVIPASLREWDVDVALAGAHKWLLGPEGTGIAYFDERARDRITPPAPGWASVTKHDSYDDYTLEPLPDARRYEGGTETVGLLAGLRESLSLLVDAGMDAVWQHVDALGEHLVEQLPTGVSVLSDRSPDRRSSITTIAIDGVSPDRAVAALVGAGIVVKARGGGVRFAPHGYMSHDDVDDALRALAAL